MCVCGYISMSCASSSDRSLAQLSDVWSSGSLRASSVAYFFVYSMGGGENRGGEEEWVWQPEEKLICVWSKSLHFYTSIIVLIVGS